MVLHHGGLAQLIGSDEWPSFHQLLQLLLVVGVPLGRRLIVLLSDSEVLVQVVRRNIESMLNLLLVIVCQFWYSMMTDESIVLIPLS